MFVYVCITTPSVSQQRCHFNDRCIGNSYDNLQLDCQEFILRGRSRLRLSVLSMPLSDLWCSRQHFNQYFNEPWVTHLTLAA